MIETYCTWVHTLSRRKAGAGRKQRHHKTSRDGKTRKASQPARQIDMQTDSHNTKPSKNI